MAAAICSATTRSWRSPTRASGVLIGGFNIEDDYFRTIDEGGWRDLGLLVEGPAAARLVPYYDALHRLGADQAARGSATLRRIVRRYSEISGPLQWQFGGPMRRRSPWAVVDLPRPRAEPATSK